MVLLPLVIFALHDPKHIWGVIRDLFSVVISYWPLRLAFGIAFLAPILVVIRRRISRYESKGDAAETIICVASIVIGIVSDAVLIVGISMCC